MSIFCLRNKPFQDGIHQYGWNQAFGKIKENFHNENSDIAFDDFLEFTFFGDKKQYGHILPYSFNWIGCVHHPASISFPFDVRFGSACMFNMPSFSQSLPNCKKLVALSKNLKRDLSVILSETEFKDLEIVDLVYPTKLEVPQFSFNKFKQNSSVVCLGWWLRRLESLYKLQTKYPKFFMIGRSPWAKAHFELANQAYADKRHLKLNLPEPDACNLFVETARYDDFLASTVVFLDLMSTSANTAIVECIASSTPVLVNPLDAVVEYLGEDYPFYYDSMQEASDKINNLSLIKETHEYLLNKNKDKFKYDFFIESFSKLIK